MRIGITTHLLDQKAFGMSKYVKNLVGGLLQLEKDLDLYLLHTAKSRNNLYSECTEILLPHLMPFFSGGYPFWLPFYALKERLDLIHYPSQEISPFFWIPRCKKVVTVHGVAPLVLPPHIHEPMSSVYKTLKYLHGRIDAVITVSKSAKKNIVTHLNIPPEKIRVVYHGVEEFFRPITPTDSVREEIETKYNVKSPFILDISRTQPKKNIPNLIKAFYKLKKGRGITHSLLLVGGGASDHSTVLHLIEQLRLKSDVIFAPYIPVGDMPKIYSAAEVLVFPSLHEGFGLPILEAMACGCPVITSNVFSMPEIAGEAAILVDPYKVDEIADAIYQVLTDNILREKMREKGLQRAQQFSWRKCAQEHVKVYEEVCYE